jgi:hypothetical protein
VRGIAGDAAGRATIGRGYRFLRDALVVSEVALAFVLALGAALVMRELARLHRLDPGMATPNVVVLHLTPLAPAAEYYAIEDHVSGIPGVQGAGFIQMVPLQNWGWEAGFEVRDRPQEGGRRRVTELRYVTPGYFRALGIKVVRGRGFLPGDTADAPPVIVVNEALARRHFPNEDPIGRQLDRGTIIGIIADDAFPLLGLLSQIAPVIIAGNTCVCLASQEFPYPAIVLGELLAVSDLPGGVVNLLTGFRKELVPTFATHTHIRGVNAVVSQEEKKQLQLGAAESIKRVRARKRDDEIDWTGEKSQSVYEIRDFIEFKTTWHPIGA